jgi:uncharacterized protein YjeT (DUF2065 family)
MGKPIEEFPEFTDEQLRALGLAAANVEAAIEKEPDAMAAHRPEDHAAAVGDALVLALALKGFIVQFSPEAARRVRNRMERPVAGRLD